MSATDLERVVEDGLAVNESVDYLSFFVIRTSEDDYRVTVDGHLGFVDQFGVDEYDSALELVDDLNRLDLKLIELVHHQDGSDALVEWAGKMMTANEELAEEKPELYTYIPPRSETEEVDEEDFE